MQRLPGVQGDLLSTYLLGNRHGDRSTAAFVAALTDRSAVERFALLHFAPAFARNVFATVRHLSMHPLMFLAHLAC